MTSVHRIQIPIPFPLKQVNAFYIHDSEPTLIDTGINTDEAYEVLSHGIEKAGGNIKGLRRIIITHCHIDHVGLAGRAKKESNAEVWLHKWDINKIYRGDDDNFKSKADIYRDFFISAGIPGGPIDAALNSMYERFRNFFGILIGENALEGGEIFKFDDFELEIIHTPGHSPGSVCLYNRQTRDIFSGDTLLEEVSSNPVAEITPPENGQVYQSLHIYQKSLAALRELDINRVAPGHGSEFSNHRDRIDQLFRHHKERRSQLLELLREYPEREGKKYPMTQFTLSGQLFPDLKGFDIFLGISEVRGHLEILEKDGLVHSHIENGKKVYSLV